MIEAHLHPHAEARKPLAPLQLGVVAAHFVKHHLQQRRKHESYASSSLTPTQHPSQPIRTRCAHEPRPLIPRNQAGAQAEASCPHRPSSSTTHGASATAAQAARAHLGKGAGRRMDG